MVGNAAEMSLPAGAANNSSYLLLRKMNDRKVINNYFKTNAHEQHPVQHFATPFSFIQTINLSTYCGPGPSKPAISTIAIYK
jgi:hypothetical protein